MIKWTKKMPKKGGVYLTKDKNDIMEIAEISYAYRQWYIYDYPYRKSCNPLGDNPVYLWGPRLE